jgi:pantothenate synthetase
VTLLDASVDDKHLVVLAAAKLGNTRLIDNIEFLRTPD